MGFLEVLLAAFGSSLGHHLPQEVIKTIYMTIAKSQLRRVWRRSIRDLIEDEIKDALHKHGIPEIRADEYIKDKKKYLKQEIRNRFDPALQNKL